jgi:hypothetical protein
MRGFRTITGESQQELEEKMQELMGQEDGWRQVYPNKPPERQMRSDNGLEELMVYMIRD